MNITINTYASADAPEPFRAVALIYTPTGKDGALQLHPVIFRAPDEDAARKRAAMWWEIELAKAKARRERGQRIGAARKGEAA